MLKFVILFWRCPQQRRGGKAINNLILCPATFSTIPASAVRTALFFPVIIWVFSYNLTSSMHGFWGPGSEWDRQRLWTWPQPSGLPNTPVAPTGEPYVHWPLHKWRRRSLPVPDVSLCFFGMLCKSHSLCLQTFSQWSPWPQLPHEVSSPGWIVLLLGFLLCMTFLSTPLHFEFCHSRYHYYLVIIILVPTSFSIAFFIPLQILLYLPHIQTHTHTMSLAPMECLVYGNLIPVYLLIKCVRPHNKRS